VSACRGIFAVVDQLLITLELALRLYKCVPAVDVLLFTRLQLEKVSRAIPGLARVEEDATGGIAVSAAASSFLVVTLKRRGDTPVYDESDLLSLS